MTDKTPPMNAIPWSINDLFILRKTPHGDVIVAEYPDCPVVVDGLKGALKEVHSIVRDYHGIAESHPRLSPGDAAARVQSFRVQLSKSDGNTRYRQQYSINDVPHQLSASVHKIAVQRDLPPPMPAHTPLFLPHKVTPEQRAEWSAYNEWYAARPHLTKPRWHPPGDRV